MSFRTSKSSEPARQVAIVSERQCMPVLQVDNAIMVLASPYPKHGLVEVINQTAQIVTGEGNPVPLSEVCAPISAEVLCLNI